MTILKQIHGGAWNTLITPYDDPEGWQFKQFPTIEMAEEFAFQNHLIMKRDT